MGVVISSTDEGVGSSCEITSWAELWGTAPNSSNKRRTIMLSEQEASVHGKNLLRDDGNRAD
jgi:hypothetical protein